MAEATGAVKAYFGEAVLRGAERKAAMKDITVTSKNRWRPTGDAHVTRKTDGKLFRIGKDTVLIRENPSTYFPVSLSKLEQMVKDAKKLPITDTVKL